MRTSLAPWVLAVIVLAAWGRSDSRSSAEADRTTTSEYATGAGFPCPTSSVDCTTEEVVATVRQIWELSGATPSEAECMAAINSENTQAVNEALDSYSDAENQAMIGCVGTEARAREIAEASADVVVTAVP
jgi:hypothetical protein